MKFFLRKGSISKVFSLLPMAAVAAAMMLASSTLAQSSFSAPEPLLGSGLLLAAEASPALFSVAPAVLAAKDAPSTSRSSSVADALPDAPSATMMEGAAVRSEDRTGGGGHVAPILTKYIPSGWTAQPITARDKVLIGLRDLYSPLTLLGELVDAGYEQALNGQPNYGTDRGAFGERLGAAVLRDSSEGIFTDSVLSPLLHEDPRYYVEGPDHGFFHRAVYAATRPLITRTDSGRHTVNAALLLGYAAASALSYTYYPPINRNFRDTASTYGGAIGGAALGFVVSEFADQVLQKLHLEKKQ